MGKNMDKHVKLKRWKSHVVLELSKLASLSNDPEFKNKVKKIIASVKKTKYYHLYNVISDLYDLAESYNLESIRKLLLELKPEYIG